MAVSSSAYMLQLWTQPVQWNSSASFCWFKIMISTCQTPSSSATMGLKSSLVNETQTSMQQCRVQAVQSFCPIAHATQPGVCSHEMNCTGRCSICMLKSLVLCNVPNSWHQHQARSRKFTAILCTSCIAAADMMQLARSAGAASRHDAFLRPLISAELYSLARAALAAASAFLPLLAGQGCTYETAAIVLQAT